jgi:hypothetical protein
MKAEHPDAINGLCDTFGVQLVNGMQPTTGLGGATA